MYVNNPLVAGFKEILQKITLSADPREYPAHFFRTVPDHQVAAAGNDMRGSHLLYREDPVLVAMEMEAMSRLPFIFPIQYLIDGPIKKIGVHIFSELIAKRDLVRSFGAQEKILQGR